MYLEDFFSENQKVAIAFSGGVDSSYLMYAAKKYAANVRAFYVKSLFQPKFEFDDAFKLAKSLDIEMEVIDFDVLGNENIVCNNADRCYYCKKRIFELIKESAARSGFDVIIDGTNASDDFSDRPGVRALKELSILSPLYLCGITKDEVRRLSKEAGLFTWNKPAYACLATRIESGRRITKEMLKTTEKAEDYLASLGLRDFRVRMLQNAAKIQVTAADILLLTDNREKIVEELKQYYSDVYLDMEVRK